MKSIVRTNNQGVIIPRRFLTFVPGELYHLFNRGINRGTIFFDENNYLFFLYNVERYILPKMDLIAYCLMPTHYHLLILVKKTSEVYQTSEVVYSTLVYNTYVARFELGMR